MHTARKKRREKIAAEPCGLELPIDNIPKYLTDAFPAYKIEKDTVKLSVKLDLSLDFRFEENWLLVTERELLHISGTYFPVSLYTR